MNVNIVYHPFRRQTLAIKAFMLNGCTFSPFSNFCFLKVLHLVFVWGLVTEAERALLAYEHDMRVNETALRREARIDLARRGLVGTETEIANWKAERLRAQQNAALPSDSSNSSTS
jgi:hypothetical protein